MNESLSGNTLKSVAICLRLKGRGQEGRELKFKPEQAH